MSPTVPNPQPAPPTDPVEIGRIYAAKRDPGQFGPLYEAHFAQVYAFVARRVRSRAEAEDVTADVFRRALEAMPRYESRGAPFSAWLLRIAANAVADLGRKAQRAETATGLELSRLIPTASGVSVIESAAI